ncbi:MAG TPA: 2,3-bisphosphoglycerate-independent phosphoglycerate mutase [Flavobacteriaceae bacterium]|nr:2,3-bisphosphoglycerate-independent phosphoglycerate mutase [Flavobacteriaceae bacterium]
MNKKVQLIILDGWGITQNPKVSAIFKAKTPFFDSLLKKYPNASLRTDGLHVGLPEGQMGNSEVGHMNLGAGRVVYQNLVKINKGYKEETLDTEKEVQAAFDYAKKNNKNIHLLGLLSDGGIHSHINHLKGLLRAAKTSNLQNIYVHSFTDGRDCDPKSGIGFIQEIEDYMQKTTGKLASVIGRYYAMDRDTRWERVKLAYDLLVKGEGLKVKGSEIKKTIQKSYDNSITDEFLKPIVITDENNKPITSIQKDDVVIFFNYRSDRGRELTQVLTQEDFPDYNMKKLVLHYVTMTTYNDTFKNIRVIFPSDNLENTLGEVLEKNNKKQIRIAETEKYPHVTFFFSGGREKEFKGEKRILCPSPKVATYDLQPEMSANDIKDAIIPELNKKETDFICLNFANTDMVGHTGVFKAAVKAAETVDDCLKEIVTTGLENGYTSIVIADHGNAEKMINEDGSVNTAHTTYPVPFIVVDKDVKKINHGVLANIAPTILELIGVPKPEIMINSLL